jgi:hypothetical protein
MQIVDSTGANATDIWLNTNGTIQTTGAHGLNDVIAGYGGNVPARVAILYDQTLSGLDFTQGTLASMPTVILNFFGSNPAIDTSGNLTMSISFSTTFPLSASFVMASTVGFFQTNRCWGYASALNFADGDVGNPTTSYGFGTAGFAGINPGQSYAVQLPTDGSLNTSIYVNGVNGAAGVASGTPAGFLLGHPTLPTGEQFMEWGIWAFNFSTAGGGECDLLNTNQHDYWGLL